MAITAGTAKVVITPPVGIDLCGYAGRIPGNTGVHDDIHAKALVLSDGVTTGAIVTLDLIGLDAVQVGQVRKDAASRTGMPAENIFVAASHTHAGPATQKLRACGKPNADYVADLLVKIADAVEAASKDMRPARFGYGKGQSSMAINRRYRTPSGEVQIGENKGGLIDTEVGIWRFVDENGESIATLFNYACHAVTMGGDNRLVSGDWPGVSQRVIEESVGGQAMYLQGCCGNINPGPRGGYEVVEQNGRDVADAVLRALPEISFRDDASLAIESEIANVPLQPAITLEEAKKTVSDMNKELENKDQLPLGTVDIYEAYLGWAKTIIESGCKSECSMPAEVQRFGVDGASIVGLPGEVFVEYSLNIKKMKPNVMVSAYTNGNIGYVPTEDAFPSGGYEVDLAYKLYGEQKLNPGCEKAILTAAEHVLGRIIHKQRE